ncbi:MAG: glycoside hydrolase [Ruminococcaceae bacterium]|nr:glycoside hydrolase [Oscillospiraceae bacterium]
MFRTEMIENSDHSYDVVFYLSDYNASTEAALEFLTKSPSFRKIRNIVLVGAITVVIPLSQVVSKSDRYAMSYVFFGTYSQQLEYISVTQGSLGVISPSYFNLDQNGQLEQVTISHDFIESVHQQGMKVVPFLSNHWDRASGVAALENREQLAEELYQMIMEHHLDGINVDIENVSEKYRDAYTDLVRLLREKIPADREVSVAVAANPEGWTLGWHGSYDYKALGEIADHLFLMAYDEHYQGGESGPVASLSFVEQSIQYALHFVPREKIVLGLPFFGRIWSENGEISGQGISCQRIESIIARYDAKVTYDRVTRSPKAEFSLTEADNLVINGQTMKPGKYVIWFENSNSLKEKLALVDKYELKGAGSWALGQETADVWDYFSLWLNGKYFEDIAGHFAADAILSSAEKGYMVGVNHTAFAPEEAMTRAQAAAICARMLHLSEELSPYADTKGHWAEKQIGAMAKKGLLFGYEDGTFRPDEEMTREEVASLLYRVIGAEYEDESSPFTDVSPQRWSYKEITALAGKNILSGFPDGTFRPEAFLTRGEMAYLVQQVEKNIDS